MSEASVKEVIEACLQGKQFLRVVSVTKDCPLSLEARALWSLLWQKKQYGQKPSASYAQFFLGIGRKAYATAIQDLDVQGMLGTKGEATLPTKNWMCMQTKGNLPFKSWCLYLASVDSPEQWKNFYCRAVYSMALGACSNRVSSKAGLAILLNIHKDTVTKYLEVLRDEFRLIDYKDQTKLIIDFRRPGNKQLSWFRVGTYAGETRKPQVLDSEEPILSENNKTEKHEIEKEVFLDQPQYRVHGEDVFSENKKQEPASELPKIEADFKVRFDGKLEPHRLHYLCGFPSFGRLNTFEKYETWLNHPQTQQALESEDQNKMVRQLKDSLENFS